LKAESKLQPLHEFSQASVNFQSSLNDRAVDEIKKGASSTSTGLEAAKTNASTSGYQKRAQINSVHSGFDGGNSPITFAGQSLGSQNRSSAGK